MKKIYEKIYILITLQIKHFKKLNIDQKTDFYYFYHS